jgi:hypothetical protein
MAYVLLPPFTATTWRLVAIGGGKIVVVAQGGCMQRVGVKGWKGEGGGALAHFTLQQCNSTRPMDVCLIFRK